MTDIFKVLETGIYSKLTTTAGTAFWGAGTAARVYADQAPESASLTNYVVFFHVGGGYENTNPVDSLDVRYQVECWGTVLANARTGSGYINTALHHQTLSITGFTNFWLVQEELIRSVENVEGVQWYRRGGTYRIRAG